MTPTKKQPLFIISGASGVGKSTTCEEIFKNETKYIVMETDLLWNDFYNNPEDEYFEYSRVWMRLCANISQIGKPVVFCGCAVPEQFEKQPEREYFTCIHYLAIVCDDECLENRMRKGRNINDNNWIKGSLDFNNWLKTSAENKTIELTLLDTTNLTIMQTSKIIDEWILSKI